VNRWVIYAGITAILVAVAALFVAFFFEPQTRSGIWAGLGAAWLVQAAAFGILIATTARRADLVVAGWTVGTFLRLVVLMALAWLTLTGVLPLPAEPTLITLAVALFALLLLEPVLFRHHFETR
jgi:hypothetical protein